MDDLVYFYFIFFTGSSIVITMIEICMQVIVCFQFKRFVQFARMATCSPPPSPPKCNTVLSYCRLCQNVIYIRIDGAFTVDARARFSLSCLSLFSVVKLMGFCCCFYTYICHVHFMMVDDFFLLFFFCLVGKN